MCGAGHLPLHFGMIQRGCTFRPHKQSRGGSRTAPAHVRYPASSPGSGSEKLLESMRGGVTPPLLRVGFSTLPPADAQIEQQQPQVGLAVQGEFLQHAPYVRLDRLGGDDQRLGDLQVGVAAGR
jgi:hypothetical protein